MVSKPKHSNLEKEEVVSNSSSLYVEVEDEREALGNRPIWS